MPEKAVPEGNDDRRSSPEGCGFPKVVRSTTPTPRVAASGHPPERSEGAFTCKVKVRGRNEVEFPNGALKPTCKAAFEGHRNKTKPHKEGWPNGARA